MARHHHEEDDNTEGYFASISDLMVGILFIFLLMLTVFALNFAEDDKDAIIRQLTSERDTARTERDEAYSKLRVLQENIQSLKDEVAHLSQLLKQFEEREAARSAALTDLALRVEKIQADVSSESRRLQDLRRQLLEQIQADLRTKNVNVEISEQQDVLRLPSEEIFQLGSSAFTPRGHDQAVILLSELARLLPCYAAAVNPPDGCKTSSAIFETVLIEGHTDTVRFDNWRLSTDRARAVLDLMVGPLEGLTGLRNSNGQSLIGLAGYGESRTLPQIAGTDPRNRRIELRFLLSASHEAELAAMRDSLEQLRKRLEALRAQ